MKKQLFYLLLVFFAGSIFSPNVYSQVIVSPVSPVPGSSSSAECKAAKITNPSGSKQREDARKFPTDGNLSISWSPADCPMIIQYYQGNQLMHEVRPAVLSGAKLGIPNQGETQIKIWYEFPSGSSIADDRWLWVR